MSDAIIFRIPKLKGPSNYSSWKLDAKSVLGIPGAWDVIEKDVETVTPTVEVTTTEGQKTATASSATMKVPKEHEMNYDKAFGYLNPMIEPLVREQYNGLRIPYHIWKKLEQLYAAEDPIARHQTIRRFSERD